MSFDSYVGHKTEIYRHRQQYGGYQREKEWKIVKGKGSQTYSDGDDLTLGGGHTMQHTGHVEESTPEAYIVLLANVTPVNLIKQ